MADLRELSVPKTKKVSAPVRALKQSQPVPFAVGAAYGNAVFDDEYGSYKSHLYQSMDALQPDVECKWELLQVSGRGAIVVRPGSDDAYQALAARVSDLEDEVRRLRREVAARGPSGQVLQLLDGLIGAFKTDSDSGMADLDPEVLADLFPETETEPADG